MATTTNLERDALGQLPDGLRKELISEYEDICRNYLERRWRPSELAAGRFCEIVHTVIEGYALGKFPETASKPSNMVAACRALENETQLPRSFRILIPRLLPALYEFRNNRGVGHVGGDVDSNVMDATFIMHATAWIMGELVRVFHDLNTDDAQTLIDKLAEPQVPLVWTGDSIKRVLNPNLTLQQEVLVLLASTPAKASVQEISDWTGQSNKTYIRRVLRKLHSERQVEFNESDQAVEILPPGITVVNSILAEHIP